MTVAAAGHRPVGVSCHVAIATRASVWGQIARSVAFEGAVGEGSNPTAIVIDADTSRRIRSRGTDDRGGHGQGEKASGAKRTHL